MLAPKAFLRRFRRGLAGKPGAQPPSLGKAKRAAELNAAISRLWQAEGTHTKDAFQRQIVPLYTVLLVELKAHLTIESAEACLLALLDETVAACRYRWSVRLPMKRPGCDYRKYEIPYTYALITAMAVGRLREVGGGDVEDLAARLLTAPGRAMLHADVMVWEDWHGYFDAADRGGLFAVSRCGVPTSGPTGEGAATRAAATIISARQASPAAGSGKAMLTAIQTALEAGRLPYNGPGDPVQVDRQGRTYLVHPAILGWCKRELNLDEDLKRLENRFARLKIFKRSPGGNLLYRGRWRERDAYSQGYLVESAAVLWRGEAPQGRFVIENVTARR